jgi:AraC-like DNA-binding protein
MVGFANRQSFYASFYKLMRMTPREYRQQHLTQHPAEKVKPEKKAQHAR